MGRKREGNNKHFWHSREWEGKEMKKKLYFWFRKERERTKLYFGSVGKWERQNNFFQCGKEMGRNY